jgi:carboxymethylenebutenolidase
MLFCRAVGCDNVALTGDGGTPITAYVARPSAPGAFPGVVLMQHLTGWSECYVKMTRRFDHHGYMVICANLYERAGTRKPGRFRAISHQMAAYPEFLR